MPEVQQEHKFSFQDELRKEHEEILPPDKNLPKDNIRSQQSNIMVLDPKHKDEINQLLNSGIKAFSEGREIKDLSKLEKLDALVYAMRDEDYFGINYVRHQSPTMPQTVEETYTSKQGDCDELSRLYVVLAQELGITGLIPLYISFKNTENGTEEGHAALFFVDGQVLYIDPGFEKAYVIHTKSKNIEEVIKDPEFRKIIEGLQRESVKGGVWEINETKVMQNPSVIEATYHFEKGAYATKNQDWEEAKNETRTAIEQGMDCSVAHFNLGQAHYPLKEYDQALTELEKAVKIKPSDSDYHYLLGRTYLEKDRYADAIQELNAFHNAEPADVIGVRYLGIAYNESAEAAMGKGECGQAIGYYGNAERFLK